VSQAENTSVANTGSPSAPVNLNVVSAVGGWLKDNASSAPDSETFNVYDTKTKDYWNQWLNNPTSLYGEFNREYVSNQWYAFAIDYNANLIGGDWAVAGPGADEVNKFFDETCPTGRQEILKMIKDTLRLGTGALKKHWVRKELKQIRAINGTNILLNYTEKPESAIPTPVLKTGNWRWLRFTLSDDRNFSANFKIWEVDDEKEYRHPQVALCRLRRLSGFQYGLPLGIAAYHITKGLKMMDFDTLAAIKHMATNIRLIAADLSGVDTTADQDTLMKNLSKAFKDVETSTLGSIVYDDRHKMGYMGTMEGQGAGRDSRIMNSMEIAQSVISTFLVNYLFPIGFFQQTGANKSIIASQRAIVDDQIIVLQKAFSDFMRTQVFPEITDKPAWIAPSRRLDAEYITELTLAGALSLEYFKEYYGIVDNGKTFLSQSPTGQFPSSDRNSNNDDNPPGRAHKEGGE